MEPHSHQPERWVLGEEILEFWKKRHTKLVTDLAIAGWLCCPIEEIRLDAKQSATGSNRLAMERIIDKLYYMSSEDDRGQTKDKFWVEWEDFHSKRGTYSRSFIWNADYLRRGESHLWHKSYSLPFTNIFGAVACRVTSKILGIGLAERAWGAVKHLKTGQRAKLGDDKVKKQATIIGAACMEKARSERAAIEADPERVGKVWTDEDVTFDLQLEKWGIDLPVILGPKRIFKGWLEDWEEAIVKKNDPVHEAKLLRKYGGLRWHDVDNDKMFTADNGKMVFHGGQSGCGWCVLGIREGDGETEPWPIGVVVTEISEQPQSLEMNVEMITQEENVDSASDEDAE